MQGGARQANRAPHLVAQLRQAGEDMLDAGAWRGDALVAPLLGLGQRFVFAALALDCSAYRHWPRASSRSRAYRVSWSSVLRYPSGAALPVTSRRAWRSRPRWLFFLLDRLLGRLDNAGIDHLTTARHIAMDRQLTIDRVEDALAGTCLDQAPLECPDRGPVGDRAARAQPDKELETEAVEQLEFHLLVAEIE